MDKYYVVKLTSGPWEGYYLGEETRVVNRRYAAEKFPDREYASNHGHMRMRPDEAFVVEECDE